MKKNIFTFLILIAVFFFSACKKTENTCTLSENTLLGTYKLTSLTLDGVDLYSTFLQDCERDNTYTFNADGTYVTIDASLLCNPTGNRISSWRLTSDTLRILGDSSKIQNFNCDGFTVTNLNAGSKQVGTFVRQ